MSGHTPWSQIRHKEHEMEDSGLQPCCADESNRTEPEKVDDRSDLVITKCTVCGRRHFELTVDPLTIGIKFE